MILNHEQVSEIVKTKDSEITKELLMRWFGMSDPKKGSKYQPNDSFTLTKGMISNYKETIPIVTTIGRYIFNVFINIGCFGDTFPYFNDEDFNKFDKQVDFALIENKINPDPQYTTYQTKRAWLEYTVVELLVPGLSFNMLNPVPEVEKRKKELFKQYEKEIAAGDVTVAAKIEAELLAIAKVAHKDDPALRLYNLKKPSWGNNYKNMTIMVGAQQSNSRPGEFNITDTNYMGGINKEEYHIFGDQLITGSYNRSVETQKGGAATKEFQAALQSLQIDPSEVSDCGTQLTSKLTLSKDNIEMYLWKYVVEGNKLTQITPTNHTQFVGRPINVRSTLYCAADKMCAKCAGTLYQKLKIEDAGLTCAIVPVTIQNIAMKSMHDSTIKTAEMQFDKYFKDY